MKLRPGVMGIGFLLTVVFGGPAPAMAFVIGATAESFAVLGGSTVTNTGLTNIDGNLGVSPGTAITGSPAVTGTVYNAGPVAAQGQEDIGVAYGALDGLPCGVNLTGKVLGTTVGATTLTPGVYCFDGNAQLTGILTLDSLGQPDAIWVFQIGAMLTTAPDSQVVMAPDSNAGNVFWQVTSSATIGTNSEFTGNLIALISVTLTTGASVDGRVFARTGAITMDTNTVGVVAFVPATPAIHVRGQGQIRVPDLPDTNPAASGSARASFEFDVRRTVAAGPVTGTFEYFNAAQRLRVAGRVTGLAVLSRNPNGSVKSVLFTGRCMLELPRCLFAVTVTENAPDDRDKLGITVTGALNEVRAQRLVVLPGTLRID